MYNITALSFRKLVSIDTPAERCRIKNALNVWKHVHLRAAYHEAT